MSQNLGQILRTSGGSSPHLLEASGVVRSGNQLFFAADGTPNAYFVYDLQPSDQPRGSGPVLSSIAIDQAHLTEVPLALPLAIDLEGIALLAAGKPVLVSERTHTLLTPGRILADYPDVFDEIGNRGLEGVAVRRLSDTTLQVAALWEGGFLERRRVPRELQTDAVVNRPLKPLVCVHTIPSDSLRWSVPAAPCPRGVDVVGLNVPAAPDTAQHFRAADLIWWPDGQGFLVLLSSQNATSADTIRYKYKWLQRFDVRGNLVDGPISLCAPVIPEALRVKRSGNVEGLGWFEEGKSVIIVNDYEEPATVAILALAGPWPTAVVPFECPS